MDQSEHDDISVLVVDDDASVREVLTEYVAERGFRVRGEPCGEAALAAFGRNPFDVVITDLKMPGMDGLEVVRRVKEQRPETEVIVVTGFATIQDGVEAMKRGAYDFLLKPIRVDQMDAVLNRCAEWVRHRRSHAELEAVNRKLLEVTRMKQRFLAVTDHELRTPVTVLDGMLHLLLKQNPELPEGVRERLESLTQVSRRLAHLVRDVHDLLHGRSQAFPVDMGDTTVAHLERGVELDLEMARFHRDLELSFQSEVPEGLTFQADAHRLRQALTELIQNAVKATPDGGQVEVVARQADGEEGPRVAFSVSDTGVGIPPEERERIFELFYGLGDERHHHSSKFDFLGAGLGIGLSIALEIARAHGGGIDLASEGSAGSTFTLWLPLEG